MTGLYYIDGLDIFTTFGLVVREGFYNQLLKRPTQKGGYTFNWPDQDGTERDFSTLYYETRVLDLPFTLNASSEEQFYLRYEALSEYLENIGYFNFDAVKMNRRFRFCYSSMPEFEKLTQFASNNNIKVNFTLTVFDDFPTMRISPAQDIINKFVANVTADGGTVDAALLLKIFTE